ncbi:helix-turn-helix transcriptional regulator [Niallia sp. Man26]|uniref:helix-turn-helix domain-containing protein n=1 Tax=Niallia sp. Man26 TaxID=2912824 RepID=UPI0024A6FD5C|nr:helix-turn-helix transcriptional regulator [Niallia sp. Man26]
MLQIKKKMLDIDIGQREIAEMTGLTQPAISRMFNMDTIPRIDTLLKVLYALGIEMKIGSKE